MKDGYIMNHKSRSKIILDELRDGWTFRQTQLRVHEDKQQSPAQVILINPHHNGRVVRKPNHCMFVNWGVFVLNNVQEENNF